MQRFIDFFKVKLQVKFLLFRGFCQEYHLPLWSAGRNFFYIAAASDDDTLDMGAFTLIIPVARQWA